MYPILDFIDSPEIRKHNEKTVFTPAQQAVLIMRSRKKSMEERLDALQHLVDVFTEEEFGAEGIFREDNKAVTDENMREITIKNIAYYRGLLEKRYHAEGCVFAVALHEKADIDTCRYDVDEYGFRADYESAFQKLQEEKAEYENDADLQDVELWGEIIRIPLKKEKEEYTPRRLCYRYNHDLKLVEAEEQFNDNDRDQVADELPDEIALDWEEDLNEAFGVHISTPFRPGDLVKSVSFCNSPFYGVIHGYGLREKMDKEWWEWQDGVMGVRLDISWESNHFGWEHDLPILSLSYCKGKEIPYDNRLLKLLSHLRKGELDMTDMLRAITCGDADGLLKCFKDEED
ncbi:MAG: hypothetical protein NC251_10440 [Lachnoclostridium sp.]|nr:hypothetical protein [Lachnospira sp.]MCM1248836.1 hypothetical protein [Lachnoclostridium sp.]MCM1535311.1 hypothetical protein [Clostridium sp.]